MQEAPCGSRGTQCNTTPWDRPSTKAIDALTHNECQRNNSNDGTTSVQCGAWGWIRPPQLIRIAREGPAPEGDGSLEGGGPQPPPLLVVVVVVVVVVVETIISNV